MTHRIRFVKRLTGALGLSARILVPAIVVLAVVVAAAAIKGWPIVPFIQASGPKYDPADWCREHGVPESLCTLCHPELKGKVLWCAEHGLPEALCTLCHPELAECFVMCEEHGLPESYCTVCNPPVAGSVDKPDWCADLLPQGPNSVELCRLDLPFVKLASAQTGRDAGIEAVPAQTRTLTRKITCNGQATYDQNHLAQVRPRVEGIVREVRVEAGTKVRRGDVLAVVDSVRLGEAKAGYLSSLASLDLAEKNFGRLESLAEKQIIPGKSLLEAETRLSEARIRVTETRQRLLNFGISPADIEYLVRMKDTSSLLSITAPLDGVIVRRHAVQGEAVQATTELFAVADLTTMWVHLDLYENDLRWVRAGQPMTFTVKSLPGSDFQGEVTWINPEVNARTRTIQVRAKVENRDGLLRSGMYGGGIIQIDAAGDALVVPKSAVQWHERSPVVFVKKAEDLFEPRRVNIGRKEGPFWEVTVGIKPNELVVTTGSFLLKTELTKGAIGAGCCGD